MAAQIAILILRIGFGGLFFYSGITKIREPIIFLDAVRGFRAFEPVSAITGLKFDPQPIEAWIAMGLPWLEIFCGATVLVGIFHRGGLTILCGLIVVFIAAFASAWSRDLEITCGCFGTNTLVTNYFFEIMLRCALLAVGVALLFFALRENARKSLAEQG